MSANLMGPHRHTSPTIFPKSKAMPAVNVLLFLIAVLAFDHRALAQNHCHVLACPVNSIPIRFPFRVGGEQSQSCGYPGFNLSCSDQGQGTTALDLPQAGEFYVRDISYLTQQIQLYDPDGCLPRRFLDGLHLSGSPFVANFLQNFTFITCPALASVPGFTPVACLTNDSLSVLATPYTSLPQPVPESCKVIATLQVPVPVPEYEGGLEDDLVLSWYEPYCRDCEIQGGTCGFFNASDEEIDCFFHPSQGERQGLHVFRIIAMSIALPAILLTLAIACFACFTDRRRRRTRSRIRAQVMNSAVLPPEPMTGLDESTIESYTKVVLGESRRLPGPNDSTCSICLSEYCPKETLKCIPECKHCFHVDCIDQWLRLNATCPVCRKSPSPSPSPSAPSPSAAQAPS